MLDQVFSGSESSLNTVPGTSLGRGQVGVFVEVMPSLLLFAMVCACWLDALFQICMSSFIGLPLVWSDGVVTDISISSLHVSGSEQVRAAAPSALRLLGVALCTKAVQARGRLVLSPVVILLPQPAGNFSFFECASNRHSRGWVYRAYRHFQTLGSRGPPIRRTGSTPQQ